MDTQKRDLLKKNIFKTLGNLVLVIFIILALTVVSQ